MRPCGQPHNESATTDGTANRPGPKGWAWKGPPASLQMLTGYEPGSALRLSGGPFQAQREPFSLPPRLLNTSGPGGPEPIDR